jgi:maltooligosyltrehalose trehalohydrolase
MAMRRLPVGAEPTSEGVHFRVWAPRRRAVEVLFEDGRRQRLDAEPGGYFGGLAPRARAGDLYRFRLDGGEAFPDPASRYQPEGPHGPSQVVDPGAYAWRDGAWRGLSLRGQVLYELHVGTFTRAGTFAGAARELPALADLGVTVVEVMPIADFPGRFGWGYDGVNLFAPSRLYGAPDDLRRFVDTAHGLGLGVILDVVFNHLGPDGNYLGQYADAYVTSRHATDWGEAINFDGEDSGPVREYFVENAGYWIAEFHLDGLRLDATQDVHDESPDHVLAQLRRRVREAAGERATIVVAENESQEARLARPEGAGGLGLDGLWNDDLHHAALVALTGRREAYYLDYAGSAQELVSAARHGFLYQGQRYRWQRKRRGTPAGDLPASAFVSYLENHDQVANSARGLRLAQITSPGRLRALTAYLLLGPGTPLLFQGQEFASTRPFLFFADHPRLAEAIREGRRRFMAQWRSLRPEDVLPDPLDPATFERCVLDHAEREAHRETHVLHRDLLRLRREDVVLSPLGARTLDGAVLGEHAFVLRYAAEAGHRLLLFNLGPDRRLEIAPEPLLAPPAAGEWAVLWSSEDPAYGGTGTSSPETDEGWWLPAESALVLAPQPRTKEQRASSGPRRAGSPDRRAG